MNAIIYKSNTGFTKKYAGLLSKELQIPCYSLEEAEQKVQKKSDVIFMGWIRAGNILGLKKGLRRYCVKAVCGVGMTSPSEITVAQIQKNNHILSIPTFYLRGGMNREALTGIYRFIFNFVSKAAQKAKNTSETEAEMLHIMSDGGDFVSAGQLTEFMNWYETQEK